MPFRSTNPISEETVRVPAAQTPAGQPYRVVLVYKNFSALPGISHAGLGVTAVNTQKYLRSKGLSCDVWGVLTIEDLKSKLLSAQLAPNANRPVTHVIISAPWLSAADLQDLAIIHSTIEFAVVCHSNVPFLAADPSAFALIRKYAQVEAGVPNFHLAGNSARLCKWFTGTYADPCWLLPNLYYLDGTANPHRPGFTGGLLKVGCFGATRILKNGLGGAAAALQMASAMRLDLEFSVSSGRNEGAAGVAQAMREMFAGIRWAKLLEVGWQPWPTFRQTVRGQDLLLQASFTETFNVVTADGVAEGVASVVSEAIDWVPANWQAPPDDVDEMATVGKRLLLDASAPADGLAALVAHNTSAFGSWQTYLRETSAHM